MIHKSVRNSRQYQSFLLTYVICTVIPILVLSIGYYYMYHTMVEDSRSYHQIVLDQQKYTYEQLFSRLNQSAKVLAREEKIISLFDKKFWTAEDLFTVAELNKELKRVSSEQLIDDIGIYFIENRSIVTNKGRYPEAIMSIFLNNHPIELDMNHSKYKQQKGYYLIQDGLRNEMVLFQKIYNEHSISLEAILFYIIPWKDLETVAEAGSISSDGGVALLSKNTTIIGNSNKDIDFGSVNLPEEYKNYEVYEVEIEGRTYIASFLQSDIFDITYCVYTPRSTFYKDINIIRIAILLEILFSGCAGLILSYYFAHKNYRPIGRMIELLSSKQEVAPTMTIGRVFEQLEDTIQGVFSKNNLLQKESQVKDQRLLEYILTWTLKGRAFVEQWALEYKDELLRSYDFRGYRLVLFSVDALENSLMVFVIKNVISEVFGNTEDCIVESIPVVHMEDAIVGIVPACRIKTLTDFTKDLVSCVQFLQDKFDIITSVAVSTEHHGWDELSQAYEEGVLAVIHKEFWGQESDSVIIYDQEVLGQTNMYNHTDVMNQCIKLSNCLVLRDYKGANLLLDEIMENSFSKEIDHMRVNKNQAILIIGLILHTLKNLTAEYDDEKNALSFIFDDYTYSESLNGVKSLHLLKKELHMILNRISVKYEEQMKSGEPDMLKKVSEYIDINYANPDLNISTIALRFNVSFSHLGKTYKKYTGMSLLDHLHRLRIEKCKELLAEGVTVKDCAEKVGYSDSKALIRAFKRYEGVTPGQFKNTGIE